MWSALAGRGLHTLIGTDAYVPAAGAAGHALHSLHATPPLPGLGVHDSLDHLRELDRWIERTREFGADLAEHVRALLRSVGESPRGDARPPHCVVHRDFHEKQIHIGPDARIGLLDFDTLCLGEPAVDIGNFLAHTELRAIQGRHTWAQAAHAQRAFLDGYGATRALRGRAAWYVDMTRLRLACVYAFRSGTAHVIESLLHSVGTTPQGLVAA